MTHRIAFRQAALNEFLKAAVWYETQRPNLGAEFISEVERCVSLAAEQPQAYAVVHKSVRRVTARRFPFSVYFRMETSRIVVLAVFRGNRDPAIWQKRS